MEERRHPGRTVLVKSLGDSPPRNLTNWAGTLFLAGSAALWRSNGTAAGTLVVKGGLFGPGVSFPNLRVANGSLYLTAQTSASASELWKSDGTTAGTLRVKDIRPGSASSGPGPVTASNGAVLFSADDGAHGVELWKSDGTDAGTVFVKDVEPPAADGSYPASLTVSGSTLYFSATDPVAGSELWTSDGTGVGTVVLDLHPGVQDTYPRQLTALGGGLLFCAGLQGGGPLWFSDGTPAGTVALGPSVADPNGHARLTVVNGTGFFPAVHLFDTDLWKTDGTPSGTVFVHGVDAFGDGFAAIGNAVYFAGSDPSGVGGGTELWRSDGTTAGTVRVKDINPGAASSSPGGFGVLDGILYFGANDGTHGIELWRSDGTEAGTTLVKDIRPGSAGGLSGGGLVSNPMERVAYDGALYFSADDGVHGFEVWRSDGTEAGTQLMKEIPVAPPSPGGLASLQGGFKVANGVLFFVLVEDPNSGLSRTSLWRTNGKASGTVRVSPSVPPVFGSMSEVGDRLYFMGCDAGGGCEPWTSDGTAPGTLRVADILPGPRSSLDYVGLGLAQFGSQLLVSARGATTGAELWSIPQDAVPDSDGDGLFDVSEASLGTAPDDPDSDDDGLTDRDEVTRHGTSPLSSDSDGDGFADGDEIAAGSDPLDPASTPQATAVPALPPSGSALLASALLLSGLARLRRGSRSR